MAGEYQLAKQALESAIADAGTQSGIDNDAFSRALLYELLELYRESRSDADVVSQLEDHIRTIQDGGDDNVSRGC